jgi:hypothetical protein
MIGNTLSIGASTVLKLVREDAYSSEYRLRSATSEYVAKIRHSRESQKTNGEFMDRHTVTLTRTDFPGIDNGVAYPARTYETTQIFRTPSADDVTKVTDLSAKADYCRAAILGPVLGWES